MIITARKRRCGPSCNKRAKTCSGCGTGCRSCRTLQHGGLRRFDGRTSSGLPGGQSKHPMQSAGRREERQSQLPVRVEHALPRMCVASAVPGERPAASNPGGGRASRPTASAASGTKDGSVCGGEEQTQRGRRDAERDGSRARGAAGAVSGLAEDAVAELFHWGGVQRRAMDTSDAMGDETRGTSGDGGGCLARKWLSQGVVCLEVGKRRGNAAKSGATQRKANDCAGESERVLPRRDFKSPRRKSHLRKQGVLQQNLLFTPRCIFQFLPTVSNRSMPSAFAWGASRLRAWALNSSRTLLYRSLPLSSAP